MAIVETVPAQVEVGETFTISGTGYTASGALHVKAYSEDGNGGISIDELVLAATAGGALNADILQIAAQEEGHVVVSITDVTAAVTNEHRIEVFRATG